MEKQIKLIYSLTIVGLISLVVIQGYWLFNQYVYNLNQYEEELFQKTVDAGETDRALRKNLQDKGYYTRTQWDMKAIHNDTTTYSPKLEWIFDTYIIDKKEVATKDAVSYQRLDSLSDLGKGVKKYSLEIKNTDLEHNVYDALERFQINELCPFSTERFDSLLLRQGIKALSVKIEVTDSMVWNPRKINYTSLWNPTMEVVYPFNILQKEQVKVTYMLGGSPILRRMFDSLLCSLVLSLLLMFCLIYQIRTIVKQQRIEELRKSFIKTMIHELKRPVSTLKMCLSFMKNEKMMQDKTMKKEIIRSSQYELDNLSSYFSKLRDLTYGDMEEIPLNLSTFSIQKLVDECIEKQNIPADRQINITTNFDDKLVEITADKMHISNILCNLLENAIKYADKETSILIDCHSIEDKYRIIVSDNGFGIAAAECPYVFDKFFRSEHIVNKNIPGIGLGLCYVKLLVTAHKGRIFLESTLGAGSKFTIEIPKKQ